MSEPCKHEEQSHEPYGRICLQCGLVLESYDYDWTDTDDDGPCDDYDEDTFDCGWVRGVGCTLAGTEECDFECPHRGALYRGLALTQARLAKRAKEQQ